jgi:hypothetical protein
MGANATIEATADAWARCSRFHMLGLVLDLTDPAAGAVAGCVKSRDASAALTLARRMQARYIALAGQLLRAKAGAFAVIVRTDDEDRLLLAVRAAAERLTELGEHFSFWVVHVPEPTRGRVLTLLSRLSATEGREQ